MELPRLEKSLEMIRSGDFASGERMLSDLVQTGGEEGREAIGHRAWLYLSTGRYEEAEADYRALLQQKQCAEVEVLLARAWLGQGRVEEALARTVEVLKETPRSTDAARLLVDCHRALGLEERRPLGPEDVRNVPHRPLNPVLETLEKDAERSFPTSTFPQVGRFIYAAVRAVRPQVMAETGTYIGYSAICAAQALEDAGTGHLHCFDLFMDFSNGKYISPVLGRQNDFAAYARGHVQQAGLAHRVTMHRGDSSENLRRVFAGKGQVIDLAFIDGDHRIKGCLKDFEAVDAALKPGGIILLHDTIPEGCHWQGPEYLLSELERQAPGKYHSVNIPTLEGIGLGIMQKKSAEAAPRLRPGLGELIADFVYTRKHWGK